MALLSRNDILTADDLKSEDVAVPEWGGTVRVKALTGAERDRLEASVVQQKGKTTKMDLHNFRAKLVALAVVDEKGNPLFSEKDILNLSNKNAAALDRVAEVVSRISGMSKDDVEGMIEDFE